MFIMPFGNQNLLYGTFPTNVNKMFYMTLKQDKRPLHTHTKKTYDYEEDVKVTGVVALAGLKHLLINLKKMISIIFISSNLQNFDVTFSLSDYIIGTE